MNTHKKHFYFSFIFLLCLSSNLLGQIGEVKPKYPKEPSNVKVIDSNSNKSKMGGSIGAEIESSDDETVVNWMVDRTGKKTKKINGVDIIATYSSYSKVNKNEVSCTVSCPHCKKSAVYEKNGDEYIQLAVDTKTGRVLKSEKTRIVKKGNRYSYKKNACCPKRKKQCLNGVAHENIWESKM